MLKDIFSTSTFNIPSPSLYKGTINSKLIEFIETTLVVFQNQFKRSLSTSEEVLSEHLAKTFDYNAKSLPFLFQKETIQKQPKGQNRKVDIGVFNHYADYSPIFTLEAKRLPTLPKKREKEYVIGNNKNKPAGGIERYKLNLHGVDLSESALIAYVQAGDFKDWQKEINNWIHFLILNSDKSKLLWTSNDLLINTCNFEKDEISKFISNSEKINKTNIKLFHYFINLK